MGPLGGLSPGGGIALGIVAGLLSTSVQSLGLTLQRKSHILEDEKGPYDVRRPAYRRRRWQAGMGMFIIANLAGSSVQITMLPLPVLSTLQAAGLVFNSICASLILNEPFTRWSFCGTALVTAGAVLIATFGAIPSPAHDLRELLVLMARWQFIVWMSLQAACVVAVAVAIEVVNKFSSLSRDGRFRLFRGITYGLISGDLSAHALLFAKSAVELIIKSVGEKNQFVYWQTWMILLALVVLALSQLYYLHRGLKLVSTSVLYPLVFCVYNIIAILDGLIYFDQTSLISVLRGCLIALGTVVLLSGVLALSWRLSADQHTPGVGQSSLAPGLGLVEDTEGEEDSLLGSEAALEEGDAPFTYQTFPNINGDTAPLSPTRRKSFRWAERDEIWGELEDQENPPTPTGRLRANTMPGRSESAPLLLTPRGSISGAGTSAEGSAASPSPSARRMTPRRRKSTGFPGLVARRQVRRRDVPVSEQLGNIISLKWWRHKRPVLPLSGADTGHTQQRLGYRDDPEPSRGGDSEGSGRANNSAV